LLLLEDGRHVAQQLPQLRNAVDGSAARRRQPHADVTVCAERRVDAEDEHDDAGLLLDRRECRDVVHPLPLTLLRRKDGTQLARQRRKLEQRAVEHRVELRKG
jgi:hypothetical protein